jgi:transcriptional regulator with XRE-family HTH domain
MSERSEEGRVTTAYYRIDGQRLAQARRDAFLTQLQLSEKSGISLATIQGLEQPRRSRRYTAGQRAYTVIALANAAGITPRDLLCISSPQGNEVGKPPDTEHVESTAQARQEHVTSSRPRTDVDLGVDLGSDLGTSQPLDQDPKAPQAASNGNGKSDLARTLNALNLGLVEAMWARHAGWDRELSFAYLQSLTTGSEKRQTPAFGAKTVNAAIDDLYANADGVSNPAGYLRERAEAHSEIP